MGRKLYVGNLPYDTGEQDLQDLFGETGTVESVSVMRDMATGRARGFAFVEMSTDADAQNAIAKLNDQPLGGRNLTVNEARPRPERSGGFGGGGGGQWRSSARAALVAAAFGKQQRARRRRTSPRPFAVRSPQTLENAAIRLALGSTCSVVVPHRPPTGSTSSPADQLRSATDAERRALSPREVVLGGTADLRVEVLVDDASTVGAVTDGRVAAPVIQVRTGIRPAERR